MNPASTAQNRFSYFLYLKFPLNFIFKWHKRYLKAYFLRTISYQ